jgi:hypothetical protein
MQKLAAGVAPPRSTSNLGRPAQRSILARSVGKGMAGEQAKIVVWVARIGRGGGADRLKDQRSSLAIMVSADLLQTEGLGLALCSAR